MYVRMDIPNTYPPLRKGMLAYFVHVRAHIYVRRGAVLISQYVCTCLEPRCQMIPTLRHMHLVLNGGMLTDPPGSRYPSEECTVQR